MKESSGLVRRFSESRQSKHTSTRPRPKSYSDETHLRSNGSLLILLPMSAFRVLEQRHVGAPRSMLHFGTFSERLLSNRYFSYLEDWHGRRFEPTTPVPVIAMYEVVQIGILLTGVLNPRQKGHTRISMLSLIGPTSWHLIYLDRALLG